VRDLQSKKAVVIGGGLAGLATASLLAKQGWLVTLLEKNSELGGRARVKRKNGFTFDMGPSWYMMPEIFDRFFQEFGKKTSDYYSLIRLNPRYTVFFDKEPSVTLYDNIAQNAAEFEAIEPGAGMKLQLILQRVQQIYQASTTHLLYEDIWNVKNWIKVDVIRSLFTVFTKIRFWETWDKELRRHFKNEKLQKILGFPAVFLGGSPFNTPSLYSILSWADFGAGIWYPKGGMGKVVDALQKLCVEQGVQILTNQEVSQINTAQAKVTGVSTQDGFYPADIVVGAADLHWLETRLLPTPLQTYPETYWKQKQLGISALMIYIGLNARLPKVAHHNMYFTKDWQKNFEEIFDHESLPSDPSLYISIRSASDRSIVPKDGEEIVVLVPLASKITYSTAELRAFKSKVIKKVEQVLQVSIQKHVVVEDAYTPNDFAADYHAHQGTALGLAHTFSQSLWFRPDNRSKKVKGLYYAGQYTNPGVGVPMALVSAQMTAKMIGVAPNQNQSIFKKGSTTYYYSSLFFQGQVKQDVFSLYAYVRVVDDFVDSLTPQLTDLERVWKETLDAWNGRPAADPVVRQFIELAKRKHFQWEWIEAFWQAMRSDLTKKSYDSLSELEEYMYGSAEVVGYMMVKVLDLPKEAMTAARLQGKAMQLLNFIRDVDEDEKLGRKYLVYKDAWKNDKQKWSSVIHKYLDTYFKVQQQAEKGYKYIPKQYLIPIKTAADMYKKTAKIIQANPDIVWQRKVKPKKWEVIVELIKNTFTTP